MSRLAERIRRLERHAGLSPHQAAGPSLADVKACLTPDECTIFMALAARVQVNMTTGEWDVTRLTTEEIVTCEELIRKGIERCENGTQARDIRG